MITVYSIKLVLFNVVGNQIMEIFFFTELSQSNKLSHSEVKQ